MLRLGSLTACAAAAQQGPCDIYDAAGTPCVAAFSLVRALYTSYNGTLYTLLREDNLTKDVGVLAAGGFADSATHDSFCGSSNCTIHRIFDQSARLNHLAVCENKVCAKEVNASKERLSVGGHEVYAAYFEGGMGYRNDTTNGVAKGEDPESMYMVTAGKHYNNRCCFDFGNAELNEKDDGTGSMEAIYWGSASDNHMNHGGAGKGPWVMADLEKGLWGANVTKSDEPPIVADFVTAMVKGKGGAQFAVKGCDAQNGTLQKFYEGKRPSGDRLPGGGHYNPMKLQGGIILGIGGDNSAGGIGTFYEGAITAGYSSDATDDAIQANIVMAGYGRI